MKAKKRVAISLELKWFQKHHQEVFAGALEYARKRGDWDCLIGPFPERNLEKRKMARYCDAILARVTGPMVSAARAAGIPIVNVWYSSPVIGKVPTVVADHKKFGQWAAQHLMARGFRRFSYIGLTRRDLATKDRYEGFAATLREARHNLINVRVPSRFSEDIRDWERFHETMEEWIARQPLPVGILCDDDLLARYVANHLEHHGISVPHQAAIVGVGNSELVCTHPEPSLTSIDGGYRVIGFHAAELLDQMIGGKTVPPRIMCVPSGNLVVRRSTDALVVEDPLVAAALHFIAGHCQEAIRVRDVAAAVHVSRRTLDRQFRSVLNQSVARQISIFRVERAKQMLANRDHLGKLIARQCGFPSMQQMWLTFKRVTGMSPKAFCWSGKQNIGAGIKQKTLD